MVINVVLVEPNLDYVFFNVISRKVALTQNIFIVQEPVD